MNEIAIALGIDRVLPQGKIECHSFLAIGLPGGAELDACAVCCEPAEAHPADAFPEDDDDAE